MKFIVKQCIGGLIFATGVGIFYFRSVHNVPQPEGSPSGLNFRAVVGLFCLWMCFWNAVLYIKFKKKQIDPSSVPVQVDMKPRSFVPQKMKIVTGAVLTVDPHDPKYKPAPDPLAEEDLKLLSNGFWGNLKLECYTHITYQNIKIDLAYTSDKCTAIVYVLGQDGIWQVEPATGNFINTSKVLPAPVAILKQQVAVLRQVEEEAQIIPVILLMRGTIQDEDKVLSYLKQNDITLAKYDNNVNSSAPTLISVLQQHFEPQIISANLDDAWEELDEQQEQQMVNEKQEANDAQDKEKTDQPEG
ncbi:MAG: hypothetical protein J6Y85_02215 [Alphaproteobacteria bacterium]|nr:hypothetical protein [Alphaproteobacteria bacterium]